MSVAKFHNFATAARLKYLQPKPKPRMQGLHAQACVCLMSHTLLCVFINSPFSKTNLSQNQNDLPKLVCLTSSASNLKDSNNC